jgi:hypothetical protein
VHPFCQSRCFRKLAAEKVQVCILKLTCAPTEIFAAKQATGAFNLCQAIGCKNWKGSAVDCAHFIWYSARQTVRLQSQCVCSRNVKSVNKCSVRETTNLFSMTYLFFPKMKTRMVSDQSTDYRVRGDFLGYCKGASVSFETKTQKAKTDSIDLLKNISLPSSEGSGPDNWLPAKFRSSIKKLKDA